MALRLMRPLATTALSDDINTQFNALVADIDRRTGNKLAHLVLALAAERAIEPIL